MHLLTAMTAPDHPRYTITVIAQSAGSIDMLPALAAACRWMCWSYQAARPGVHQLHPRPQPPCFTPCCTRTRHLCCFSRRLTPGAVTVNLPPALPHPRNMYNVWQGTLLWPCQACRGTPAPPRLSCCDSQHVLLPAQLATCSNGCLGTGAAPHTVGAELKRFLGLLPLKRQPSTPVSASFQFLLATCLPLDGRSNSLAH